MDLSNQSISHVIFDLDGLLIDSEIIYTDVNRRLMSEYGVTYTMEMKTKTMGMKKLDAVKYMIELAELTDRVTVDEYNEMYERLLFEALPGSKLMPSAERLVKHLFAHKVPMAICTGSNSLEFEAKMKNHGDILKMIPLIVLAGDDPSVLKGKPDPDCFIVTMERFEVRPKSSRNVLVLEDAPNGVLAAVAADMHVIMVPSGTYAKPPKQVHDKISLVLNSLEEFKPQMIGLPQYSNQNPAAFNNNDLMNSVSD